MDAIEKIPGRAWGEGADANNAQKTEDTEMSYQPQYVRRTTGWTCCSRSEDCWPARQSRPYAAGSKAVTSLLSPDHPRYDRSSARWKINALSLESMY